MSDIGLGLLFAVALSGWTVFWYLRGVIDEANR